MDNNLSDKARTYLDKLCREISDRRVGSAGNQAAVDYFAGTIASYGFTVEQPAFECIDWVSHGAQLKIDTTEFAVFSSPYSLGCQVQAPLVSAATVAELAALDATGKILLLHGELAKEQLMPKGFTFYNPDHHKEIIRLLEMKAPAAIIAATSRNPELAGGMYPYPLIEDGDFDIPSVYMTEVEGARLAGLVGRTVSLDSTAQRIPATGSNVIARTGPAETRKILLCAHIDSKPNTPGALDNAGGVVALLLLAELLQKYSGLFEIELVAFNGEDYYSAPGQVQYLQMYGSQLEQLQLVINLDGAGYLHGKTAYSLYGCPEAIAGAVRNTFAKNPEFIEGAPWYQSDHMIFVQRDIPAVAITSESFMDLSASITHTSKDRPELVDEQKLVSTAFALHKMISELQAV